MRSITTLLFLFIFLSSSCGTGPNETNEVDNAEEINTTVPAETNCSQQIFLLKLKSKILENYYLVRHWAGSEEREDSMDKVKCKALLKELTTVNDNLETSMEGLDKTTIDHFKTALEKFLKNEKSIMDLLPNMSAYQDMTIFFQASEIKDGEFEKAFRELETLLNGMIKKS